MSSKSPLSSCISRVCLSPFLSRMRLPRQGSPSPPPHPQPRCPGWKGAARTAHTWVCPHTDRRGTTSPLLNSCIPAFSSPPFPEVRGAVSSHAPGGQKMAAAARRPRRFARQGFPLLGNAAVERRRFHPSGLQGCDQGTRDTARGLESHRRRLSTKSSVREEPCKHRPGMERCLLFQAGWIFTGGFCGF